MNVLDVAASEELKVKSHYEKLAEATSHPGIRTIFTLLAGDEQKHYEMVTALRSGRVPELPDDSGVLETAREMMEQLFGNAEVAALLKKDLDGYHHAMEIEAESVRFYERIATGELDAESKRVIARILAEEQKHFNVVENLYDFALKPEYFLAWGEFSNLRDL